jgi:membrane protein implicated in regulation of membrane protease activity
MPVVVLAYVGLVSAFVFFKLGATLWWWALLAGMFALLFWRWMQEESVEQVLREQRILGTIRRIIREEVQRGPCGGDDDNVDEV